MKRKQVKLGTKNYSQDAIRSIDSMYKFYKSEEKGLNHRTVTLRLEKYGKNQVMERKEKSKMSFLFSAFADPFILVLLGLAIVSFVLSDTFGAIIIIVLSFFSAGIRYVQAYCAYREEQRLKNMIHTMCRVRRSNGKVKEERMENLVIGDVIELNAGAIIPADVRILECHDLFVSESSFTGESVPVEKFVSISSDKTENMIFDNICLMGTNVVSGSAIALVIKTGKDTHLSHIVKDESEKQESTDFEKGIKTVTRTLIRYMLVVVILVFIINSIIKQDIFQALLFSISVAVGITPGMLSMIVNVNLSKGAKALSKKKTIVKNMNSIQNLGAIDTLCMDKTGTLTKNEIVLQKYMNALGEDDAKVLEYAFLNSYFSTGIKNLVDRAIISFGTNHGLKDRLKHYQKMDEIPFDYERRKMSVVVKTKERTYRLITKGALEEVLSVCTKVQEHGHVIPLTPLKIVQLKKQVSELIQTGMRVIALAEKKEYPGAMEFNSNYENEMTFVGYVAFLDPPKKSAAKALRDLADIGITVRILTGDSPETTVSICEQVGLTVTGMLHGHQVERMTDAQLEKHLDTTNVFARLTPLQKERIVLLLRKSGHVVGYMGDGVNDAPSLRQADIGISVDTATDIAKESSDIILLERNLKVLKEGILEGRLVYGNIMKYMKTALSSNFGNGFSVLLASLFLPFLPMIPIQILLKNLIYNFSQLAIPLDGVDSEFLKLPRKWDTKDLGRFMNTMGITSSIIDVLTFVVLWFIMGYSSVDTQMYFQTGWFIQCLISQIFLVHFIRTSKRSFFQSMASKPLLLSSIICILIVIGLPYLLHEFLGFHFVILPGIYYLYLLVILVSYTILSQFVKEWYLHKYHKWL